jgi:hypothetical protein
MGEIGEGGKGLPQAHGARTSAEEARRRQLVSRYTHVSRCTQEPPLTKHKGSLPLTKHKERLLTSMRKSKPEMRRCVPCLVCLTLLPKRLSWLVVGMLALDTRHVGIQARHVDTRHRLLLHVIWIQDRGLLHLTDVARPYTRHVAYETVADETGWCALLIYKLQHHLLLIYKLQHHLLPHTT